MAEPTSASKAGFRPKLKSRQSLSSLPPTMPNKENRTSTFDSPSASTRSNRRKRAQSLGGEGLDTTKKTKTGEEELSPAKQLRRKLAPRRSILKATPAIFDGTNDLTFDFVGGTSSHTTDLSNLSTKPFGRRPSLRPTTSNLADADSSSDDDEDGEMEMDLTMMEQDKSAEDRRKSMARRVSFAPNAHMRQFYKDKPTDLAMAERNQKQDEVNQADDSFSSLSSDSLSSDPAEVAEDDSLAEVSMEMASNDVTRAFANHYRGTVPQSIYAQDAADAEAVAEEEREDSFNDDGELSMEEVTTDITSAFAQEQTALLHSQNAFKPKPRHSEVVRQEDVEDAEIMRSLGMQRGGRSAVTFGGQTGTAAGAVQEEDDFSGEEGDTIDAGIDEGEQTMDMTMAIGSVLTGAGSKGKERQSVGFAGVASSDEEDTNEEMEDQTMDMDNTMAMQEATSYGGIIATGVPTPSTPSARLQAQLFARQTAGTSPIKAGTPSAPHNSPRRSLLPPSSATKSPRRVLLLNAAPVPKPKFEAFELPSTPVRAGSPLKARTPTFPPAPSSVSARSPGGSLSLKGLLQEQLAKSGQSLSPYRAPSSLASPARKATWDSPKTRPETLRISGVKVKEEDSTGSSFGGYGEEEVVEPITSLDAFFDATGTVFEKDILAMTGVDLNHRRKSMAPHQMGRAPSGPPSFADIAVAGGCKSLFHQLYQSDQQRLQEDIQRVMQSLAEYDEALQDEQPRVFSEWSTATESHKAIMQSQFGKIKAYYYNVGRIDWNNFRAENHQYVIEVMEQNLQGLREDNALVARTDFQEVLPSLQERHAALLAEVLEERNRDLELNACDQDELQELHSAIKEQGAHLTEFEHKQADFVGQLAVYQAQEQELSDKLAEISREKEALQKMLEEGRCFTKAEVLRLKGEFDALQYLHGWELVKFAGNQVQLRHLEEFTVLLTLDAKGSVTAADFALQGLEKSVKAEVTKFLFDKVVANIQWALEHPSMEGKARHARSILNRISSLWTGARRLRGEVSLTELDFPVSSTFCPGQDEESLDALILSIEVHVPSAPVTFSILFELNGEELVEGEEERREARGSGSVVMGIGCDVIRKRGEVDCEGIQYAIRERLDAGGCYALVEACREAERSLERRLT